MENALISNFKSLAAVILSAAGWISLVLLIFIVGKLTISAIYNLYFHPLRDFPGPKLAAATPLPFVWRLINGRFPAWTNELHAKYGVVVRVHPDELSFIGSSAWRDIYLARPELPKPTFGVLETPNGVPSIVTIPDPDTHGRQRKIIGHAFSDRALREQEYILQRYSDLLVTRLQHQIKGVKDAQQVNIFDWYNFTTFDVLGDLCFGDSFHCLEEGDNHPWVASIYAGIKFAQILTVFHHFPPLHTLVTYLIPPQIKEIAMRNHTWTRQKIDQRIASKSDRQDFMKHILENNYPGGMTREDIDSTTTLLVLAGSETSATTLTGATYFPLKHPTKMERLVREVRGAFGGDPKNITVAAVSELPYLHAVIQETLRVHPTGPISMPRQIDRPDVKICGIPVPEGYRAGIPQKTAFHSPTNFVDPDAFIPERWLGEHPKFAQDNHEVFEPFMVGPRNCIGKKLAWAEMKLILAKVLWHFDLELSQEPGKNVAEWNDQKVYLMNEKTPLWVCVRERRK